MDWTDIILTVPAGDLSDASAIAQMAVSGGLYIEDYSNVEEDIRFFGPVEIIDEALLARDRTAAKIHLYISPEEDPEEAAAFLRERLEKAGIAFTLSRETVREEDWANNWKQFFKPMNIGERIRLVPSWEAESDARENGALYTGRVRLMIDPGMAFGSGQHETTRLCLELIEKSVRQGTEMLDIGTGSGILGIAGLLLGAKTALGVDIDPLSVKIAAENARLCGVGDRFQAVCGNLAEQAAGPYDLICANIVADVILALLPDAEKLLRQDGTLIVSGIIDLRRDEVRDALTRHGFAVREERSEKGWYAMAAGKKGQ